MHTIQYYAVQRLRGMSLCAPVNELRLLDQMGTGTVYVRHSLVRKLGR